MYSKIELYTYMYEFSYESLTDHSVFGHISIYIYVCFNGSDNIFSLLVRLYLFVCLFNVFTDVLGYVVARISQPATVTTAAATTLTLTRTTPF